MKHPSSEPESKGLTRGAFWAASAAVWMIGTASAIWLTTSYYRELDSPATPSPIQTALAPPSSPPTPQPSPSVSPAADSLAPKSWILPVKGKVENAFGNSYKYFGIFRGGHTGVDLAAPYGAPVQAVADGKVVRIFTKPNMRYGRYLMIQHGPKLFSLYGHLSAIKARLGDQLKQGQVIATVGNTGAAGYPHLHIEAMNRLPSHDGAWGYLYICYPRTEKATFINQTEEVIPAIQRGFSGPCRSQTLPEAITYYNPEALWSEKPQLRQAGQPENDEWQRRQGRASAPHLSQRHRHRLTRL